MYYNQKTYLISMPFLRHDKKNFAVSNNLHNFTAGNNLKQSIMKQKKEKLHRNGWKSRFVRLTSMLMLCFNVLSAPLTAIGIATIAVTSVTLVVSCDKDNKDQQQEQPQTQKHNVEFTYDVSLNGIPLDTISKYAARSDIDTIFLIPESIYQFEALSTSQMNTRRKGLRNRRNIDPNKVFGKGDMYLNSETQSEPAIERFFADTLKYNVLYANKSNSK